MVRASRVPSIKADDSTISMRRRRRAGVSSGGRTRPLVRAIDIGERGHMRMGHLREWALPAIVGAAIGAIGLVVVHGQQRNASGTLTSMDYIEIQQLVSRYPYALDTGADGGYLYADLFTPDGVFIRASG